MKLYGVSEIAAELGVRKGTVRVWRTRGKLPPPDAVLAMGPIWTARTIRPFIERTRKSIPAKSGR
jgi:transposase-like protein